MGAANNSLVDLSCYIPRIMSGQPASESSVDHYGSQYSNFATELYADIRRQAMGEDIGQNGWLTADEQDIFIDWLGLDAEDHLLDIACGCGGPTLRIAQHTGCQVTGVDIQEQGIAQATTYADQRGLSDRATFRVLDGSSALPFETESFDAVTCIDAINHLPDRALVLGEWYRVLKPGGRLVFTDPITVTGPLPNEEIATRASVGFFLFVPHGSDEVMLRNAGFEVKRIEDRTENVARVARRWHAARAANESKVRELEGDKEYEGQQTFFDVAATLAEQRRLSRFAYLAIKD